MQKAEQLSSLIGDVYDAALDPALWSAALGKTRGFVGGSAAALYSKDTIRKSGKLYYEDGDINRRYRQLYIEKYAKLDPFTTGHFFAEIEQPIATADVMPYEEFLATRFYKEWARPGMASAPYYCMARATPPICSSARWRRIRMPPIASSA